MNKPEVEVEAEGEVLAVAVEGNPILHHEDGIQEEDELQESDSDDSEGGEYTDSDDEDTESQELEEIDDD